MRIAVASTNCYNYDILIWAYASSPWVFEATRVLRNLSSWQDLLRADYKIEKLRIRHADKLFDTPSLQQIGTMEPLYLDVFNLSSLH